MASARIWSSVLGSVLSDESLYVVVLVYSVVVTCALSIFPVNEAHYKKHVYCSLGVALIWMITGPAGLLWSAIFPTATILSLVLLPRNLSLKFFLLFYIATMSYTKFFGVSGYSPLINALLMISSLKCISLISDVQSGIVRFFAGADTLEAAKLPIGQCKATTLDILYYSYCYCGVFTGPFFSYRTYYDMLFSVDGTYFANNGFTSTTTPTRSSRSGVWKSMCLKKFAFGIALSGFYIFFINRINFKQQLLEPFLDNNHRPIENLFHIFFRRAFFLTLFMYCMKCRYISCWSIMESIYIALGLGAYPSVLQPRITTPPKLSQNDVSAEQLYNSEISYLTVQSSDWRKMEFSIEMVDIINGWNSTVNYFMSHYIGGLFVPPFKAPMTMLFSAFWHGIHLSYYIAFYTTVGVVFVQKYFVNAFANWLPPYERCYRTSALLKLAISKHSYLLLLSTLVACLINVRLIEYTILPFFFLDSIFDSIGVWKDLFFFGHVYILVLFLSGFAKNRFSI